MVKFISTCPCFLRRCVLNTQLVPGCSLLSHTACRTEILSSGFWLKHQYGGYQREFEYSVNNVHEVVGQGYEKGLLHGARKGLVRRIPLEKPGDPLHCPPPPPRWRHFLFYFRSVAPPGGLWCMWAGVWFWCRKSGGQEKDWLTTLVADVGRDWLFLFPHMLSHCFKKSGCRHWENEPVWFLSEPAICKRWEIRR